MEAIADRAEKLSLAAETARIPKFVQNVLLGTCWLIFTVNYAVPSWWGVNTAVHLIDVSSVTKDIYSVRMKSAWVVHKKYRVVWNVLTLKIVKNAGKDTC